MLIRIIAVGTKMPRWVDDVVADYSGRLPAEWKLEWKEVKAEPRTGGGTATQWMAREAERIRAALPPQSRLVILDERGDDLTTDKLARAMSRWRDDARPVALVIGGPDGLDPTLKAEAAERIRLSSLTLPHPMVRVVLAEQLFRGWSILANHPYHRA